MSEFLLRNADVLADAVLAIHFSLAAFVVVGQLLIPLGALSGARWVRNWMFRAVHLGLMIFIAGETALGVTCPLTRLEQTLRASAGQTTYSETFIAHWLSPLLFFDAPPWAFVMLHGLAAIAVAATWILVPPDWPRRAEKAARGGNAAHR